MRVATFNDLVRTNDLRFSDGYRTKRSELAGEGYRILRAADVNGGEVGVGSDFVGTEYESAIGDKVVRSGDIALTTKGTVGRVAEIMDHNELMVYSPQVCFFRTIPSGQLKGSFLRYWFNSREFWHQCSHLMSNTDMAPYLSLRNIGSLKITLPTIVQQTAIAAVLGALDDKIAANTALAHTAGQLAITHAGTAPGRCPVGQMAQFDRTTIDPSSLEVEQVAHYSLPAFDMGLTPSIDLPADIKSNKFWISTPCVLVSKLNPRIPRIWAVDRVTGLPGVASTEFMPLISTSLSYLQIWAALSNPRFGQRLEAQVAGTSGSHQRVRPDDLMLTEVDDPRLLSTSTRDLIDSLVLTGIQARSENRTLAELRDTLLPALMSGRLRVKDAERQVEDVV